ncbi:hypothetical protein XENTR_v10016950 [Xenopus tropicalis]|nr:hypothetical protein XENTR_v10016950 [Xenopus tropicalis]
MVDWLNVTLFTLLLAINVLSYSDLIGILLFHLFIVKALTPECVENDSTSPYLAFFVQVWDLLSRRLGTWGIPDKGSFSNLDLHTLMSDILAHSMAQPVAAVVTTENKGTFAFFVVYKY